MKVLKKLVALLMTITVLFFCPMILLAAEEGKEVFLVHLKTSLKRDDAQICVAYNIMWAAQQEGMKVKVLVDADAVNTYKVGWRGKDDIEDYRLPENTGGVDGARTFVNEP